MKGIFKKLNNLSNNFLKWWFIDDGWMKLGIIGIYSYLLSLHLLDSFIGEDKQDVGQNS